MVLITRKAEFSASHRLANPDWSDEKNAEVFGIESQTHGHNYVLEVTVAGDVDPVNGMIMDLKELKDLITREIIEPWDHRHLNHEAPPFDRIVPTAENLVKETWKRLEPAIHGEGRRLHSIRLYETSDLYVDYTGPVSAQAA
ncbi:MAG: 6-carboxytetrahydropterin synthase [Acidobacteria bacterium]|nr:6-carboxytetrahydropterin synthase [Acidobacteriota bacterium]MDA1235512.1 6-carboxytetrahydropterin synthase [Acidobacteriota bacterium]